MNEIIFPSNNPNDAGNFFLQCFESGVQYPLNDDMYGGQLKLFNITRRFEKNCKLFKCKEKIIELVTNDSLLDNYLEAEEQYYEMYRQMLSELVDPIDSSCKVRLSIAHDDFNENVNLEFMDKDKLTVDMCFDALDSVVQSKKKRPGYEIQSKNKMSFSIIIAENPKGAGRKCLSELEKSFRKSQKQNALIKPSFKIQKQKALRVDQKWMNKIVSFEDFCKQKKSILVIENTDNFCLIRAILIAKAYVDKDKFPHNLTRPNNQELTRRTLNIVKILNIPNQECGVNEIHKIENYLEEYQIMVYFYFFYFKNLYQIY